MTAALLDELETAGVRLSLAESDLRYETQPGISIAPYRERIAEHKQAILVELLQREIVEAAGAARDAFDRQHYDRLWARWHALQDEESCP